MLMIIIIININYAYTSNIHIVLISAYVARGRQGQRQQLAAHGQADALQEHGAGAPREGVSITIITIVDTATSITITSSIIIDRIIDIIAGAPREGDRVAEAAEAAVARACGKLGIIYYMQARAYFVQLHM